MENVRLCTDTGASEVAHYVDIQLRLVSCFSEYFFIDLLSLFDKGNVLPNNAKNLSFLTRLFERC